MSFGTLRKTKLNTSWARSYGFLKRGASRNHPDIDLLFPRQSQTCNNARAEVNEGAVRAWDCDVGVKHRRVSLTAAVLTPDDSVGRGILLRDGIGADLRKGGR